MRFKEIARIALCGWLLASGVSLLGAEQEGAAEPPFREAFFMSEIEREQSVAQAVRVGGVVFVSATMAVGETFEEQMRTIYMRLQAILANYGLSLANVAQERIYAIELDSMEAALELRQRYYRLAPPPATTWVQVAGLPGEGHLLSIELVAVADPEE